MPTTDLTATNQRLIDNDLFCVRKLAEPIRQLLSLPTDYPPIRHTGEGWMVNGEYWGEELTDFRGVIDLETTGLFGWKDSVICAVGIGYIGDQQVVVSHGNCDRLPIFHSTIFNINQSFDRSFYLIENGKDTNTHIDLSSLAKMTHGTPNKSDDYGFGSFVSLSGLHDFYFGSKIDKSDRDELIAGNLTFDDTVSYCLRDVIATVKVAQRIIPEYVAKSPSPISLNGYALRSFSIPISKRFNGFHEKMENWFAEKQAQISEMLFDCAIDSLNSDDPSHLCLFDQFPESFSTPKNLAKTLKETNNRLADYLIDHAAENPRCLNKQIVKVAKGEATFSSGWVALLVSARYNDEPLLYDRKGKEWHWNGIKLLNQSDSKKSLSTPFCKDYYSDELLTSKTPGIVELLKGIQLWISFRSRVAEIGVDDYGYYHAIYSSCYTLTGRSKDNYFLLFPKPKFEKGGSEIITFIESKPGYKLVVVDFDSAELVYASDYANHWMGENDQIATEFARIILEGDSKEKTDVHSLIAVLVGISRAYAKNLVYGANYGQGREKRIEAIQRMTKVDRFTAERIEKLFTDQYIKGKASPFFKSIKYQADMKLPTSLLEVQLPSGLMKTPVSFHYTTRTNRVIQALGSDHLNLLITDVERCVSDQAIDATLILTRHDEALYEVKESDVESFSQLLQSSHRFTRELLLARLGINQTVEKWLSFSSVDVMDRYCESMLPTCTSELPG